ncbi:polysaccharide deacetylase family protein [Sulfobacillus harzensis]|uniref:Polysaccharide deacetylase family protein n=1 Tax=Sulfobacillus harzensis TaxID=2729629 RepID=A0A7Y0L7R9_9FIRM|nr:polysaccharide deacetylase family protein [Sulfobacillus harzensis]
MEPAGGYLVLTFDDGPDDSTTPAILNVLSRYGVPATFFCVGSCASRYPKTLRAIAKEGHKIGNHSWDHLDLTTLQAGDIHDQLDRTNKVWVFGFLD